jgi:hypothetical protein
LCRLHQAASRIFLTGYHHNDTVHANDPWSRCWTRLKRMHRGSRIHGCLESRLSREDVEMIKEHHNPESVDRTSKSARDRALETTYQSVALLQELVHFLFRRPRLRCNSFLYRLLAALYYIHYSGVWSSSLSVSVALAPVRASSTRYIYHRITANHHSSMSFQQHSTTLF